MRGRLHSDLDALSALDSNRDRKIDATDLRFSELKVWVDGNRNGVTDGGELRTLQDLCIASISLSASATDQRVKPGQNILIATSSFTLADGTVRSAGDAALAFKPTGGAAAAAAGPAGTTGLLAPFRNGWEPGMTGPDEAPLELAAALRAGLGGAGLGSAGLTAAKVASRWAFRPA